MFVGIPVVPADEVDVIICSNVEVGAGVQYKRLTGHGIHGVLHSVGRLAVAAVDFDITIVWHHDAVLLEYVGVFPVILGCTGPVAVPGRHFVIISNNVLVVRVGDTLGVHKLVVDAERKSARTYELRDGAWITACFINVEIGNIPDYFGYLKLG